MFLLDYFTVFHYGSRRYRTLDNNTVRNYYYSIIYVDIYSFKSLPPILRIYSSNTVMHFRR
jgi:hypothetical protein